MTRFIVVLATLLLGLTTLVLSVSADPGQNPAPGDFDTPNQTAPANGEKHAECDVDGAGALTVVRVLVNGVALDPNPPTSAYTVTGNGTTSATVNFTTAPPAGATVNVEGTTANSGSHHGTLSWS